MQELKGRIKFLESIPTFHGVQDSRRTMYGEQGSVTYQSEIRKSDLDKLISDAREEIDTIQDNIDRYNGANHIQLELVK